MHYNAGQLLTFRRSMFMFTQPIYYVRYMIIDVRQTRMTFDIGYSRDNQNTNTKEKGTIQSNS